MENKFAGIVKYSICSPTKKQLKDKGWQSPNI